MTKALTVSEAKPRLGTLLDQVSKGKEVWLRRKKRLYRVEEVFEISPIPARAIGHFQFDDKDELTALANRAEPSADVSLYDLMKSSLGVLDSGVRDLGHHPRHSAGFGR